MDNRIREIRDKMGLTQQQLAEEVNVTSRTIISLEKGQYNPSVLLAHKLAKFFDCTIEELFCFSEEDGL